MQSQPLKRSKGLLDDFEELYEHAPCGYISTTPDGIIVRVNETFVRQIGRRREELLAQVKFHELMTLAGRVFYDTHFAPLIRIRGYVKEIACDLLAGDGRKLPVLVNAVQVTGDSGEPEYIRFTVFDATERRRYETDLLAARRRADHFKTIVQLSADSIISVDAEGNIKSWNRGAEAMFGLSEKEAIDTKVWDVIHLVEPPETFEKAFKLLKTGQPFSHLGDAGLRNGETIYVSIRVTPHIEPPGEFMGVSAIIRDITERKRIMDARHRQELLQNLVESQEAERQRFARDLHDHLGQQLTGLRFALINLKATLNPEAHSQLDSIEEQALQIDRDLSFLAFELRPTMLADLGLFEALNNFVSEWSANHSISATFHGKRTSDRKLQSSIEINIYRIAQESLNNILKHAKASNVTVLVEERESEILLIVEDDGVGFEPGKKNELRKVSGHGLGLLGMSERAAVVGGTLEIESSRNVGTTIYVRVPVQYV